MKDLPNFFLVSDEIATALAENQPVVALESTVISHGLPYPENFNLAQNMEQVVRSQGAIPATIAVLDGNIHIGLDTSQLERLVRGEEMRKVSSRDFAAALVQGASGGTTVAGTLVAAHAVGISVFATGGIGGVHRQAGYDISADLTLLSNTPLVVVCAGAKAILDLPATLEMLETLGVPVLGYQTDDFPAFYTLSSGLKAGARVDDAAMAAKIAQAHWAMGLRSAVLVTVPPPVEVALRPEVMNAVIQHALDDAQAAGIHGQSVTPFLLKRVTELTGGASLKANVALLHNNARVAGQIACHLTGRSS